MSLPIAWLIIGLIWIISVNLHIISERDDVYDSHSVSYIIFFNALMIVMGPLVYLLGYKVRLEMDAEEQARNEKKLRDLLCAELNEANQGNDDDYH